MEIQINSVDEYIKECFSTNKLLKKNETQVFYRGVNQIYPEPHKPSIYYPGGFIENEDIIFKEAISYFPEELLAQKTTVEKLIIMQHYRFPTRIMDISKNPLIALFFACFPDVNNETFKEDGMVYLFKVPEKEIKYCDSDAVSVIANLCKRPLSFSIKNTNDMEINNYEQDEDIYEIQYLVHEIRDEKPYFKVLVDKKDINSVVCMRPRMNNPRIVRQDGYFFLFGINYEKKDCAILNPDWIGDNKFLIPHNAKQEILEELKMLNINEAFVYPDYEHISKDIKNRYRKP
jgi:hypothetical protein